MSAVNLMGNGAERGDGEMRELIKAFQEEIACTELSSN